MNRIELLLKLSDALRLGYHFHGADLVLFVLAWDISLFTSALTGCLEEVSTNALRGYSKSLVNIKMQSTRSILLT